ncbi:type IV-A pilus assembly ATPase PilB [candidate division WOR-3 bacterium RBG_13_43_14]|uniref:Type IV-A pilus assembly ATPase PilB n=1 Tax=candidate division WOR-3 bacterium RBG_13_43_14 TaxID=1802590 RepID=A0A1F4UED8_UNCW3|nr:MAG: type IV-A pilus assembly ATPase PilB [candidate division WOR-3 bacterium RBG_13_43_14]
MEEKLGSYLVQQGVISEDQLRDAIRERRETGQRLVSVLNSLEMVSEGKLLAHLSNLYKMEVVDLDYIIPDKIVLDLIPAQKAYHYEVLPIDRRGRYLTVAMVDPTDISAIEDLRFITSMEITPVLAAETSIRDALDRYYTMERGIAEVGADNRITAAAKELGIEDMELLETEMQEDMEETKLRADAEGGPVIRLVNFYIADAVNKTASDIHVEHFERQVRVRFRVDGILQEQQSPPLNLKAGIITRIKLMAKMDIAEHRQCQDGRINIQVGEKMIDLRVSVIPTLYGEKIVMRILDRSSLMLDLSKLGFGEGALKKFLKVIESPYGIILVTGPTGSGKTTTLYSTLSRLNKPDRQIMTIEDPVEYNLHGINQIQVHEEIGLSFAAALRAFLRQAPNIILVGEIRDSETAEIAIRASLTGHLVFSTIHTNDAPTTINRLIDIGIKPYLVASALILIQAQRLVRRICPKCKEQFKLSDKLLEEAGLNKEMVPDGMVFKGKGCSHCNQTGYKGRIGLYEVMPVSSDIRNLIFKGGSSDVIAKLAIKEGMETLRDDGLDKIRKGVTTVEELMRETSTF